MSEKSLQKKMQWWELEEQKANEKRKEREQARYRNLPKWARERIEYLERQVENELVALDFHAGSGGDPDLVWYEGDREPHLPPRQRGDLFRLLRT